MAALPVALLMLLGHVVLSVDVPPPLTSAEVALVQDDECSAEGPEGCALNALQLRGGTVAEPPADEKDGSKDIADNITVIPLSSLPPGLTPETDYPEKHGSGDDAEAEGEASKEPEDGLHPSTYIGTGCPAHPHTKRCYLYSACHHHICDFGGYMIVPGKFAAGMESINGANAASFNYLMDDAHKKCSDTHCVLITNPVMHRTQDQLHIHFRHYNAGGARMKTALEARVCHKNAGWHHFMPPGCGPDSKAAVFDKWPGVFSVVANAYGGMPLRYVGITVWQTAACGGGIKTIVLAATHCSIEHSVSAR